MRALDGEQPIGFCGAQGIHSGDVLIYEECSDPVCPSVIPGFDHAHVTVEPRGAS